MNTFEMIFNNYEDLTVSELEKLIDVFEKCLDEKQDEKYEINFDDLDLLIENAEANIEGARNTLQNKIKQRRLANAIKFEKIKDYINEIYIKYKYKFADNRLKFDFNGKIICLREDYCNGSSWDKIEIANCESDWLYNRGSCKSTNIKLMEYKVDCYSLRQDIPEYLVENWTELKPYFDKAVVESVKEKLNREQNKINDLEKQYK